eukprot:12261299-Heterocapsa_arctica.AAC.1
MSAGRHSLHSSLQCYVIELLRSAASSMIHSPLLLHHLYIATLIIAMLIIATLSIATPMIIDTLITAIDN